MFIRPGSAMIIRGRLRILVGEGVDDISVGAPHLALRTELNLSSDGN
jgi:hypothetical protein